MPGIKGRMTGEYDARSESAVIVGVDTAIGFALAHSLRKAGFGVIGFGEAEKEPCNGLLGYCRTDYSSYGDIPEECNLLLFCHDAAFRPDRHAAAMEALCRKISEKRPSDKPIAVCVFTPANACDCTGKTITEDAALMPRSLRNLAHVQAEMMLHAWHAVSKRVILPRSFRYGELYADMPNEIPLAGHVNACLRKVRRHERLVSPGLGNQRRTLTHLEDFANMVALVVSQDFIPSVTNIPGETMEIIEYMMPLEKNPEMEMFMDIGHYDDDLPYGVGDRVLYCPQFMAGKKNSFKYSLRHKFRDWAAALPENAPGLESFDITKA